MAVAVDGDIRLQEVVVLENGKNGKYFAHRSQLSSIPCLRFEAAWIRSDNTRIYYRNIAIVADTRTMRDSVDNKTKYRQ